MNAPNHKVAQYLFITILAFHTLVGLGIGFIALTNPKLAMEVGLNLVYDPKLRTMTIIIGMQVLFLASMAILAIIWTLRKSIYGIYIGAAVGLYLSLFGIVSYLISRETGGLTIDSIRGIITLTLAYFAHKEMKQNGMLV